MSPDASARPAVVLATVEITDPEGMGAYYEAAVPAMKAAGGVALGLGAPEPIEGELGANRFIVASVWPSAEAARAFWASDVYGAAIELRSRCSTVVAVVDELSPEALALCRGSDWTG